jgi:hypothetical protein
VRLKIAPVRSIARATSPEQIAEATYDPALFNLFVRLADAFDIHPPPILDTEGVPRAATE